jgi:hypothetical protein
MAPLPSRIASSSRKTDKEKLTRKADAVAATGKHLVYSGQQLSAFASS